MIIEDNIVNSAIAHIQGKRPDSPRYNSSMTDEERDSVENLIVLCPNHHNLVDKDPEKYNAEFLMQIKTNHEKKHQGKQSYDLPEDLVRIVSISVNNDEYSTERVHNLLNLYKRLEGTETKKIWRNYFMYALKALKISSPLLDDEKEALRVIWKDILDLKCNEELFPELVLAFLGKVPIETRREYGGEIKSYIEDLVQNDVENPYLPRLYVYLNKSEIETLDYLIDNANKFSSQKFSDFLSITGVDFRQLGQELFLELEVRLWIKLGEAERRKEEYPNLFENIKTLVNKFINVTI